MIKTIFLDLDGPILDGRLRHYQCYSDILREHGFVPMPIDEYWSMKRNRVDRLKQLSVSGAEGIYKEFLQAWLERIENKNYLSLDRLQAGAVEKMKGWRSSGLSLILVTMRNNKANLEWQLASLGLLSILDQVEVVGSEGGECAKADAVKSQLQHLDGRSILWIGDTEVDIKTARILEINVVAVGCGLRTQSYLAELGPDFLVSDLQAVNLDEMEQCNEPGTVQNH